MNSHYLPCKKVCVGCIGNVFCGKTIHPEDDKRVLEDGEIYNCQFMDYKEILISEESHIDTGKEILETKWIDKDMDGNPIDPKTYHHPDCPLKEIPINAIEYALHSPCESWLASRAKEELKKFVDDVKEFNE